MNQPIELVGYEVDRNEVDRNSGQPHHHTPSQNLATDSSVRGRCWNSSHERGGPDAEERPSIAMARFRRGVANRGRGAVELQRGNAGVMTRV